MQLCPPASCTLLGVTTLWPQVYTSPSHVSTTVWRLAAATASMTLPCSHTAKPSSALRREVCPGVLPLSPDSSCASRKWNPASHTGAKCALSQRWAQSNAMVIGNKCFPCLGKKAEGFVTMCRCDCQPLDPSAHIAMQALSAGRGFVSRTRLCQLDAALSAGRGFASWTRLCQQDAALPAGRGFASWTRPNFCGRP